MKNNQNIDEALRRLIAGYDSKDRNVKPGSALVPLGTLRHRSTALLPIPQWAFDLVAIFLKAAPLVLEIQRRASTTENVAEFEMAQKACAEAMDFLRPLFPLVRGFAKLGGELALLDLEIRKTVDYLEDELFAFEADLTIAEHDAERGHA